jgi:cytochrome c5
MKKINLIILTAAMGITVNLFGCGGDTVSTTPPASPTKKGLPDGASEAAIAGQLVVKTVCASCHLPGLAGAPKIGDVTAWAPRIEKGVDTLVDHATNGYEGPSGGIMPPRGGEDSLTGDDIKNAVAYFIEIHSK